MPTPRASGGTNARSPAFATVWPPILISPASGTSKPATSLRVVVLPQPDGPTSPSVSPRRTVSDSASTAAVLLVKRLVTPSRTSRSIRSGHRRQGRLAVEDGQAVADGQRGHGDARLAGGAGDVRGQGDVVERQQPGMNLRLLFEHVEPGPGDPPLRERAHQRRLLRH